MKTAGIIAEYNPFHKGHEYQIRYTKEKLKADYVIVAMSGDYVQRGTPALISKHARAEMALRCGADLVLEMPVSVSTASAEAFAMGGVSLLDGLGVVDMLCFGSESGEISALKELAEILVEEPEEYKKLLKSFLSEGLTFPAARSQALTEYFKNPRNFNGDDFDGVLTPLLNEVTQILNTPNNILGIEYCKAILEQEAPMTPVPLPRVGAGHGQALAESGHAQFASASALRALWAEQGADALTPYVPEKALELYKKAEIDGMYTDYAGAGRCELALLRAACARPEPFAAVRGVSEGLDHRLENAVRSCTGLPQLLDALTTVRYPRARMRRLAMDAALGYTADTVPALPPYLHLLGARREALPLLKHAFLPLSHSLAKLEKENDACARMAAAQAGASDFGALCRRVPGPMGGVYRQKIIFLTN